MEMKNPIVIEGINLEVEMRVFLIDLAYKLIKDGYVYNNGDIIQKFEPDPSHISFVYQELRREIGTLLYS